MTNTIIIAEIGVNHNGSVELAKQLIDVAASCGADFAKFQSFTADSLVTSNASKAPYQVMNTKSDSTQHSMLKGLELSRESHFQLKNYCKTKNIGFMTSPFDVRGINLVKDLQIEYLKIPSGEITNFLLLEKAADFKGKIILSTGMASLEEIGEALAVLLSKDNDKERISVLQCTTEYPAPLDSLNLLAMRTIKDTFKLNVGFSDHSLGTEAAVAAVALGASMVEKHITLDNNMNGPDHKSSLMPDEFKLFVQMIRNVEKALGSGIKYPSETELKNIPIVRKSLVALKKIKIGEKFTRDNIGSKRPGYGISPMFYLDFLGTVSRENYEPDDLIKPIDV